MAGLTPHIDTNLESPAPSPASIAGVPPLANDDGRRGRSPSPWSGAPSSTARTLTPRGLNAARQAWAPVPPSMRSGLGASAVAVTSKQLEALEEKLSNQIAKGISQNKSMCEAAFSRLDTKIANLEYSQPSMDRKIAELSGNVKGLTEEVQSQLRSIESFDVRLREWRQGIDDECKKRIAEVEQRMQNSSSAGRLSYASLEDQQRQCNAKLYQLENAIGARMQHAEEAFQGLLDLEARLEAVEVLQQDSAVASGGARLNEVLGAAQSPTVSVLSPAHLQLQDQLNHALEKIETVAAQNLETHARIEEHGVRLNSMRSKTDAQEQTQRGFGDRMQRVESRVEELKQTMADRNRQIDEFRTRVEQVAQKTNSHVRVLDGTFDQVYHLYEHIFDGANGGTSPSNGGKPELGPMLFAVLQAFVDRFDAFEDELRMQSGMQSGVGESNGFALKVHTLVDQLRDVVPKMVRQEQAVKNIESQLKNIGTPSGAPLIGFDFDCTITVRHYYKCLAWGLAGGNESAHPHCKVLFDWLRARKISPQAPHGNQNLDAVVVVTEFLIQTLGSAQFRALFREVFLGGEDRISVLTAWLREKRNNNVEMAIITAGIASAVSRALQVAVPEWSSFFPPDMVLDIGHHRHQVNSITGAKALILRDRCQASKIILLVDDSLCKDELPDWIASSAHVKPVGLPYEGSGLEKKVFHEIDTALAS